MAECSCGCSNTSGIACNISVFDTEGRSRYDELKKELTKNLSIEEIASGYIFIYPNEQSLLLKITEWISFEYRCCPFIKFSL
ncbi:hypothetical protein ACFQ3N_13735 [Virgibacillus byunsanensis]|uniref:Uncharacterized protein n=1 Tax=Virgibacillus byunsanensis TaxID=570945 RepID=A0ABW3LQ20_9BACI